MVNVCEILLCIMGIGRESVSQPVYHHHHHHHHHRDICTAPITVKNEHKRYICYGKIDKKRLWLGLINTIC